MTSSSKHTIQRVTDGLFESVVAGVHKDGFTDVEHNVELFDALLAKIIIDPSAYEVVLVLNEYGDFLSDMASGLVGSLGTGCCWRSVCCLIMSTGTTLDMLCA